MDEITSELLDELRRDQYVHYLTLARRLEPAGDWPRLRAALVGALRAAYALDGVRVDLEPLGEEARVLARLTAARDLVDDCAAVHDPDQDWDAFFDLLWDGRGRLVDLHPCG